MLTRLMTAAVAAAAFAVPLAPAAAVGCAGLPDTPVAYVCVESVTPENAVPDRTPGSASPVDVPSVCYVAGCTDPTTVYVPGDPGGIDSSDDPVVVVTWNGETVAIYMGRVPRLPSGIAEGVRDFVEDPCDIKFCP